MLKVFPRGTMQIHILVYILFGSVLLATAVGITQYELVDLGLGVPVSINNSGQIVGVCSGHATIFDTTGGGSNIDLGSGVAWAINDNGRIVGSDSSNRLVIFNLFGGVERVLDNKIVPKSINNNDQIAGSIPRSIYDSRTPRAYFLDPVSGYPNYTKMDIDKGWANSINDSGQIVGCKYWESTSSEPFVPVGYDWQAVIFDTTGSRIHTYLGSISGREEAMAWGINDGGKIVGHAFNYNSNEYNPYGDIQAVLFDETGGGLNKALGSLDGYVNSTTTAINSLGQIIGYCFNDNYDYPTGWEGDPHNRATIFVPDGINIDLNTMLINPLPGWTLTEARAINDDGWIVGLMVKDLGGNRFDRGAFLLKPVPEPATFIFVLLGSARIAYRRRVVSKNNH